MTDDALRVGLIGLGFMGKAHSHAWASAARFFDLPRTPVLQVIAGRDADRASAAARTYGWQESTDDWHRLLERDDIDVIDICTPGDTHAELAIAALQAGKHVMCEKPLANTVEQAEQMTAAARDAASHGVAALCGFSYRRTPALSHARDLVAAGRLGTVRQVRGRYLQDWLSDPRAPWTWRLDADLAGSGALGDIGAHLIDAAQFVSGLPVVGVSALLETFVHERPVRAATVGLGGVAEADAPLRPVTVDDAALFTARLGDGSVTGSFEATRFALGRKNAFQLEVNGTAGSVLFDFEEQNILRFYDAGDPTTEAGFRRILVTEADHPYAGHWWPTGHGLGYGDLFVNQVADFVQAIADGTPPSPSFAEALQVQRVLAAVHDSAADDSRWVSIPREELS